VKFIVVGGMYTDTDWTTLEVGTSELYGPFDTMAEARTVWWEKSCKKVDRCLHRLTIKPAAVEITR